jgi:hypothetical protein
VAIVEPTIIAPEHFAMHVKARTQKEGHSTLKAIGSVLLAKSQ